MKFLSKFLKLAQIKKIANLSKLASLLGYKSPATMLRQIVKEPMKIIKALEKLGVAGRRALGHKTILGEVIVDANKTVAAEDKEPGTIEEQILYSSWQYFGTFEYITNNIGTLWITTKFSPKEYMFPSFPAAIWDLMRAARGSNGSGSGTVWWQWYRKFRSSKTAKSLRAKYK